LRKVTLARGAPVLRQMWLNSLYQDRVLTTAGVVDNLLYDTPNVSIALGLCPLASVAVPRVRARVRRRTYEVERAELGRSLVQAGVGREDRAATLTLVANDPTHGDGVVLQVGVERVRG
jgi:hypothetical protein